MKKEGERKAQVTVFIIIGLILLVSASIVIYMTTIRKVEVIEEVIVPPEVKPVYDYVTNCLYEIGNDALILIGAQGGYADLSSERIDTRDITMTPSAYIKIDPSNTFKLPLWYYDGEDRIPPLEFIQKELADHVAKNLALCIDDFNAFKPRFEIEELGRPQLSSIFTGSDVVVRLNYPLSIREGDRVTQHAEFISHIPVKMRKMWELAKAIMETENEQNFFENLTIDLISMDRDIPMDGLELRCGLRTWRLEDVEKDVQRLIYYNLPHARVKGTDYLPFMADDDVYEELREYTMKDINEGNYPKISTPRDAFEYNRMMLDPGISDIEDLRASFIYLSRWGMDLNALPNEAGMLRSNMGSGQDFLRFLCINTYHFTYDIIYPIQVRILDPEAYNGVGYVFQFGFNVVIDDNEPKREEFGVRGFEDYYVDVGFCEQTGGEPVEIRAIGYDEEGYMMDSGLKDVNVTYGCATQRCFLGQTGYDPGAPGRYSLITSLPLGCANPIITVQKDGYLPATGQLTEDSIELEMIKLRDMSLRVVKHTYTKMAGLSTEGNEITKGDQVSASIRLKGKPVSHTQYFVYSYGDNETPTIELVDGTAEYDFDVMYHNYDRFVGGYKSNNVTIKYGDFSGYDEIVLHVFEYRPRPVKPDQELDMLLYYMGREYQSALRPTFR